ncbi:hypothetical protein FOWG_17111 [Fusarium oxysporum f. sp. lycopersici MN25]|nr:hypothetical protein FOWG_18122 [Fusarium oxysporum f. sp. lycopersici MN25]EWZ78694.1 hypothetical protein FOWG_17111 [Fusarium oxysporum f. sp. lycopersici MN25]
MEKPESPFYALQQSVDPSVQADSTAKIQRCSYLDPVDNIDRLFTLAYELHEQNALPALVFNYDRSQCETAARSIVSELIDTEAAFKESDRIWKKKLRGF